MSYWYRILCSVYLNHYSFTHCTSASKVMILKGLWWPCCYSFCNPFCASCDTRCLCWGLWHIFCRSLLCCVLAWHDIYNSLHFCFDYCWFSLSVSVSAKSHECLHVESFLFMSSYRNPEICICFNHQTTGICWSVHLMILVYLFVSPSSVKPICWQSYGDYSVPSASLLITHGPMLHFETYVTSATAEVHLNLWCQKSSSPWIFFMKISKR